MTENTEIECPEADRTHVWVSVHPNGKPNPDLYSAGPSEGLIEDFAEEETNKRKGVLSC